MNLVEALLGGRQATRSGGFKETLGSDPAQWFVDTMGGGASFSGVSITRDTVLAHPPVWRAVHLISSDISKIPLDLFRRLSDGGRERDRNHVAFGLVRRRPAPGMTARYFWQTLLGHVLLSGNAYAFIFRDGSARIKRQGLSIVNPEWIYPVRMDGRVWYVYTPDDGRQRRIPERDILHIRGLGFDGLSGYSVMEYGKDAIGLGVAVTRFAGSFFKNNAVPRVVLEHPGQLKELARKHLRESWDSMLQGLPNQHKTTVLWEGVKANVISQNAKDSQLAEVRIQDVRDVANLFGIPPHKLGDPVRTSYSSLEQEERAYVDQALDGWMSEIESECWSKLLTEEQKVADSHFFEFNRKALVRANIGARFTAYSTALNGGWMSRNEVRAAENLNPIEGGDEFLVPLNMATVGADDTAPATDVPPPEGTEGASDGNRDAIVAAHTALLTDAIRRMTRRAGTQAKRRAKGARYYQWLQDEMEPANLSTFCEVIDPVLEALSAVGIDVDAGRLTDMHFGALREAFSDPASIETTIEEVEATHPGRIAALAISGD